MSYSKIFRSLAGVVTLGVLMAGAASANGVFGCSNLGAVQIVDTATTFCVGDSGYSNEWYARTPTALANYAGPLGNLNLLGASNQFLIYDVTDGTSHTIYSAWLNGDAGGVGGLTFTTTTPVLGNPNNTATHAESAISDTQVGVAISSTTIMNNIKQAFTITNQIATAGLYIDSMTFVEYLQYFPFGSTHPNLGTLNYQLVPTIEQTEVLGLWGTGDDGIAGFVRSGGACGGPGTLGCSTPDGYMIGASGDVITAVGGLGLAGLPNSGPTSSNMPAAGAISWSVSGLHLNNGDSQAFTVELVPEPATFALSLIGGLGLWLRRRKV